jgi:hypothetical protein
MKNIYRVYIRQLKIIHLFLQKIFADNQGKKDANIGNLNGNGFHKRPNNPV